jgi:hypothetical protein
MPLRITETVLFGRAFAPLSRYVRLPMGLRVGTVLNNANTRELSQI